MRKIYYLFLSFVFIGLANTAFAQNGELKGKVIDSKTKEAVPFASVSIEFNGTQIAGNKTDFDGNYYIKPIPPGRYDVKISVIGYNPSVTNNVLISSDRVSFLDKSITSNTQAIKEVEITEYVRPLIERDNTTTGGTLTSEEIRNLPTRNINAAVATSAGVYQKEEGDGLNIKGSRDESNEYFIDGIKVRGLTGIPQAGIEQITVITGGVPAQYGDATGGIISITTKGPSKELAGGVELVTSEGLNAYGYNLAAVNLSGPIIKRNAGTDSAKALLGFFVSAELESQKDQDPSAIQLFKVKDDVLNDLRRNPRQLNVNGNILALDRGEFVKKTDLEKIGFNENNRRRDIRLSSRIDYQLSQNSFFRLGATANFRKADVFNRNNYLFNSQENSERLDNSYRVFARYTQKFAQGDDSKSFIRNAFFEIQADYSKSTVEQRDPELRDNLFRYGQWGKFNSTFRPVFAQDTITINGQLQTKIVQQDLFSENNMTFERLNNNEVIANYASQFYDVFGTSRGFNDFRSRGGVSNGDGVGDIYNSYNGLGTQSGYVKLNNDQYRLLFTINGSIKNHSVQAGLEFEQRVDRSFRPSSIGLWNVARLLANNGLVLDRSNPIQSNQGDTVFFNRTTDINVQSTFDRNLRKKLGLGNGEYIDIDSYDASVFSLDLFSADELIENNRFTDNADEAYRGFSYDGKRLSNNVNFDDFFSDTLNRPIGAFQPVYIAGYIQDKFTFKDIIFNLGLRIDRFDANQKVLKDKYSLFAVKTKSEVEGIQNIKNGGKHPNNIGNDFVVYGQNSLNPNSEILGYRSGDIFYDALGNEVSNANAIIGDGGSVNPIYNDNIKRDASGTQARISSLSFKDFQPKTAIMPRVSFSFPISDEAAFFANYDVLTQRAQSRVYSSPLAYYNLERRSGGQIIVNPDLNPERTTDYQVGFKQKVGPTSALTITSFYRELRDQLQFVQVNNAAPITYNSFQNQDFGTVKGFTFAYDLRRTNNASLRLSYTLQFANGTGSESTSAGNLINLGLGNVIIPNPLDFDQRHNIVASFDYRYGSGANYNGPDNLRKILQNLGANLIVRGGSGTPFSRQTPFAKFAVINYDERFRTLVGSLNGSRTPFTSNIDLRIDKDFDLMGNSENQKNKYFFNVYLQIQNILNTQNVINVYPTTGNAIDDGYLTSTLGLQEVNASSTNDSQSLIDLYRIKAENPNNFSAPRVSRLGLIFNF